MPIFCILMILLEKDVDSIEGFHGETKETNPETKEMVLLMAEIRLTS